MYLPATHHDDGAALELKFAQQLRATNPAFDHTRVDLTPFRPLRAKIDCITIDHSKKISSDAIKDIRAAMCGTVRRANNQPRSVTIHDPTVDDLQYLLDHYPTAHIGYIEIAVDAYLPQGSNDLYLLRQLKEQIRHCLAPQQHPHFKDAIRTYWDLVAKRRVHDAVSRPAPLTTVYHQARRSGLDMKLYVKTIDQNKPAPVCLRIEFSMRAAAAGWAGLDVVSDLPAFAKNLRKYCSKAFFIGQAFKESDTDGDKWKQYGAAWDLQKTKGLRIEADTVVNRAVGDALHSLGRSLQKGLKLTCPE